MKRLTFVVLLCCAVVGCESDISALSDEDLADKMYECNQATTSSPGFSIRCDNYRRECKKRRKDGRFVC